MPPIDPDQIATSVDLEAIDPANPGQRTKAYRLRAKQRNGEELKPTELDWLAAYETAQSTARTASASERIVHTEERHVASASATGDAAAVALASAQIAREEGRRLDYLAKAGIEALVRAVSVYESMTTRMMARMEALEEVHLAMLDAVRDSHVKRAEAEAEVITAQAEQGGAMEKLLEAFAPAIPGIVAGAMPVAQKK